MTPELLNAYSDCCLSIAERMVSGFFGLCRFESPYNDESHEEGTARSASANLQRSREILSEIVKAGLVIQAKPVDPIAYVNYFSACFDLWTGVLFTGEAIAVRKPSKSKEPEFAPPKRKAQVEIAEIPEVRKVVREKVVKATTPPRALRKPKKEVSRAKPLAKPKKRVSPVEPIKPQVRESAPRKKKTRSNRQRTENLFKSLKSILDDE